MHFSYHSSPERPLQVGLIVLQADETIERDMKRLLPDEVELLISRVPSGTEVSAESLSAMETELVHAASLFPKGARFACVGYGCTSGTAHIGIAQVAQKVSQGTVTAKVTDPVSALLAACRHLGVSRLGLLSPYVAPVSDKLRETLKASGIEVSAFASFDEAVEENVVRISESSIVHASRAVAEQTELDALFISCTNLRTLGVIDQLEAAIGIPVLTSNQVLAWSMLQCANVSVVHQKYGQIWLAEGVGA